MGFSLIVVLIVPSSFFYQGKSYLKGKYEMEGKFISSQIQRDIISLSPVWWQFEEDRLRKYIFHKNIENVSSSYMISDSQGEIIIQSKQLLTMPIEHLSFPLLDSGLKVGQLEIYYSLWPLLKKSLLILFLSVITATLLYFVVRIPIRALEKAEQRLYNHATTDPLTKLYNRRAIIDLLKLEIERSKRYNIIFSLFMFDIDYFKQVNDNYGHDAGDEILIKLSKLVKSKVRPMDKISRYGGEEFLILVPETSASNAFEMAENLRKIISQYKFDKPPQITVSIGISQFIVGDTINDVLKRADISLYQAKNSGRNKVVYHQ